MGLKDGTIALSRSEYDAVIFDMDGVVTKTAGVHAAAWKTLFDEYREETGGNWTPFDPDDDYVRYVDGKPRHDGVKSFLESRGIRLPHGEPEDEADKKTVRGLGKRKNRIFLDLLEKQGVAVYDSGVDFVKRLGAAGFKTAVISSSKNCAHVLEAAGIEELFQARVDGVASEDLGLKGKPDPAIFLEAARRLGAGPARTAVVEDALSGVEAGKQGRFGLVIGVDRTGHAEELRQKGADVVVQDLSLIEVRGRWDPAGIPSALEHRETITAQGEGKTPAVFLDYDGTLTPIVDSPDRALLSESMRNTLKRLAKHATVAVISGRDLQDVRDKVGIDGIFYAGSHGFDIAGPKGRRGSPRQGRDFLPALDEAESALRERLGGMEGVLLERKKFSIAVHYRKVNPNEVEDVEAVVDRVVSNADGLRKSSGKKVYELQPDIEWDKGKALFWVLDALNLEGPGVFPLYIGDDTTDEDAFRAIRDRGAGIVVMDKPRPTEARYFLKDPGEVQTFLDALASQ
jgi:alpha,alpha-trehalase